MRLKILFFPLSVIIALSLFIWGTKPNLNLIKQKKQELDSKKEQLSKVEKNLGVLRGEIGRIAQFPEEQELVEDALPWKNKDAAFFSEIYNYAIETGVFIYSLDKKENKSLASRTNCQEQSQLALMSEGISSDEADEGTQTLPICKMETKKEEVILKLSGGYLNLKNFINKLSKANRFNKITSIAFSKKENTQAQEEGQEGANAEEVEADLTFLIFSKDKDDRLTIAGAVEQKDPVIESIFNSGASIDKVQQLKNDVVIYPLGQESLDGAGKENIFSVN